MPDSFQAFPHAGLALDPIHVGAGGSRLGRVDNTIVRDPVTRVPKVPGSSLAGVLRAYAAMANERYPNCAGQGQARDDGSGGHCGNANCPICTVFGFARGNAGGFAGLAAFTDAHVLLFPVASREGPLWLTCPTALRLLTGLHDFREVTEDKVFRISASPQPVNLGWLMLPVQEFADGQNPDQALSGLDIPEYVRKRTALVSDKLFGHVVNSNLEVRTSVAIDPTTGAAEQGALFTYEALPRATVLYWEVTCRNPAHFRIGSGDVGAVKDPDAVYAVVVGAHEYLEHLGIGGMGTRGMGRLRVLSGNGSAGAE
ncbi:MAG: type III-B CRISPR module RAMP protein Cmr4 [Rhodospirillales bacterium]